MDSAGHRSYWSTRELNRDRRSGMFMPRKSVAIIGSNGYIGRNMMLRLMDEPVLLYTYDIQPSSINPDARYKQLDVTNRSCYESLPHNIDYIYYFAGITNVSESFIHYHRYIEVNVIGLLNLLDWMNQHDCRARIIYPSTRLVYKGMSHPLNELSLLAPRSIYALNKLTCENALNLFHNVNGINFTIIRIGVPYGNDVDNKYSFGTIGNFLDRAVNGRDIVLYGSGEGIRTFTHIHDVCGILISCAKTTKCQNQVYNIIGESLSLRQIALKIAGKFRVNVEYKNWPLMSLKLESGDTEFDFTKLRNDINYILKHNFDQWIDTLSCKAERTNV